MASPSSLRHCAQAARWRTLASVTTDAMRAVDAPACFHFGGSSPLCTPRTCSEVAPVSEVAPALDRRIILPATRVSTCAGAACHVRFVTQHRSFWATPWRPCHASSLHVWSVPLLEPVVCAWRKFTIHLKKQQNANGIRTGAHAAALGPRTHGLSVP